MTSKWVALHIKETGRDDFNLKKQWLQLQKILATSITQQGLSAYWCSLARLYATRSSAKHFHPIISETSNGLFLAQSPSFSPFYIFSCLRFKINNNKDFHKVRVNITLGLMACVNIIQYITLQEKAFKFCVMPVPSGVKHLLNFDLIDSNSISASMMTYMAILGHKMLVCCY